MFLKRSAYGAIMNQAQQIIMDHAQNGAKLRELFFKKQAANIVNIAQTLAVALARGNKIMFCGNGGSAADAQHLAAELVNRFVIDRPPLAGLALTTDTSALTAISNDYSFDEVFSKQVQGLGQPGDVLVAISTSGNSPSIIAALKAAREKNIITLGLSGRDGGKMPPHCQHLLCVEADQTALIQEIHITVGHLLCELIDYYLFENTMELAPLLQNANSGK